MIAASAWAFGATALRLGRIDDAGEPGERWALSSALGLGLMAQGLFVLGMIPSWGNGGQHIGGWLRPSVIITLLGVGHLLCRSTWQSAWRARHGALRRLRSGLPMIGLATLGTLPAAALAFYPATGFDATVYHLPYVDAFLEAQRLTFVQELRFPVFPQVVEMGFVLGFALAGEATAQLTQVFSLLLTVPLLVAFGHRLGHGKSTGEIRSCSRTGWWAAAWWLGTPLVVWVASMAYVDVGLSLFVTAALCSWQRWAGSRAPEAGARHLALAGAFVGLAAGTKYLGLFFFAALAAMTGLRALKTRDARAVAVLPIMAVLFMAPWYLRIIHHTGNPVFPFYAPLFGESEWTSQHDRTLGFDQPEGDRSVAGRLVGRMLEGLGFLVATPWNAVFDRGIFHFTAPLSPYYLVLILLGLPLALRQSRIRRFVLLVTVYALFWLTTVRELRFLLPALPILNLALAGGLDALVDSPGLARHRRRALTAAVTLALLAPGPAYAAYKLWERGRLPVTAEDRKDYLTRQVPGYGGIRWLNENRGPDYTVYTLHGARLRYYALGRFLGEWTGPANYFEILAAAGDSASLHAALKELGAGYFLVRLEHPQILRLLEAPDFADAFRLMWQGSGYALYGLQARSSPRW